LLIAVLTPDSPSKVLLISVISYLIPLISVVILVVLKIPPNESHPDSVHATFTPAGP